MDVKDARVFLAVAEHLHFGRAARQLHISQPPLSRAIRALEEELGAQLFVRSSREVALTAVGEALIEPAKELLMQAARIQQQVRLVKNGTSGVLRIGFSGASVNAIVGTLCRTLRRSHPDLQLKLSGSELSHPGLERLLAGELDALIGRWDFLPANVSSLIMAEEGLTIALPKGHPLGKQKEISSADLSEESWIVLPGGNSASLTSRLYEIGKSGGFIPKIIETAPDSATQLLQVDAGLGIALTFSSVRENIPGHEVIFRTVRPALGSVQVRLAWRVGDSNPALATLSAVARRSRKDDT